MLDLASATGLDHSHCLSGRESRGDESCDDDSCMKELIAHSEMQLQRGCLYPRQRWGFIDH